MEKSIEPPQDCFPVGNQVKLPGSPAGHAALSRDLVGIPPRILESKKAFLRDLPVLLQDSKHDRWCVVYCGDERIGPLPSEKELIRECQKRGFRRDQYFLGVIAPHSCEIEEVDPSLDDFEPVQE